MANGYTTMYDVLSKPLSQRKGEYGTTEIQYIIIDGNKFGGYKTFSSYWEKTYAKQPERSASGVISNLDSYPTFTTFHLTVNFAMMSIDDYRRLYDLMLSKNEFVVTAYNVITNKSHTCKMYFAPDQMPKLYAVARKMQGEKFLEVLGVQDYTIELIGTNNDMDKLSIIYYDKNGNIISSVEKYANEEFIIGEGVSVPSIDGYSFNGKWLRTDTSTEYTNKTPITIQFQDGSNMGALRTVKFVAQYLAEKQFYLSLNWGIGEPSKDNKGNDITTITFSPNQTLGDALSSNNITLLTGVALKDLPLSPNPSIKEGSNYYTTYTNLGWKKGSTKESTTVYNSTKLDVEGNMTFYQVFEPVKNSVTFNSNGGTEFSKLTNVDYGSYVPLPIPYLDGKTFKGWYIDKTFNIAFNGKMTPYDLTIYAKWE